MNTSYHCIVCIARVLSNLVNNCTEDENIRAAVYQQALYMLSQDSLKDSPVVAFNRILNYVLDKTGSTDPFLSHKRIRNEKAMQLLPLLSEYIAKETDLLHGALKAVSAGNILDAVAVGNDRLIYESIQQVFEIGFVRDDYPAFSEAIKKAEKILYIGDNSGEIVFDRILVSYLKDMGKKITFCVRGRPAMDDALREDFFSAGLDEYCDCVDTGGGYLGYVPDLVPEETKRVFEEADIIIAKGMGNFEAMYELSDERLFFAFKAKCEFIAKIAGVATGDFCFLQGGKI